MHNGHCSLKMKVPLHICVTKHTIYNKLALPYDSHGNEMLYCRLRPTEKTEQESDLGQFMAIYHECARYRSNKIRTKNIPIYPLFIKILRRF